ncbi:hypothetical protein [Dactylosporangium fulvum]|uniref:Secreted protein n=1 Tax=Dactylosporangium fulvum TaxID=53359 RepID=A0ABY5VQS6_9ACTN|nr:hypothetical protein [Dactylosporangium fulvum]UWP79535.1 hypothetical protein Dfulv_30760 [Dactylosporangium fulvum]
MTRELSRLLARAAAAVLTEVTGFFVFAERHIVGGSTGSVRPSRRAFAGDRSARPLCHNAMRPARVGLKPHASR